MTDDSLIAKLQIASCCKVQNRKKQGAWRSIVDDKPDLTVLLGDNVYTKGWSYQYLRDQYEEQNAVEDFAHFKDRCFYLATWDDHDLGPNNSKGGTADAQQLGETGIPRRDEARNLFHRYLAPKIPDPSKLSTVPGQIYCSYKLDKILIIMLDGRYFREDAKKNPAAQFLGEDQEEWLWEQFEAAKEQRVLSTVVCCGSTISSGTTDSESVQDYEEFFARFSSRFKDCPNPVFLSGDIHQNRIRVHDGFLEIISSGIAQRRRHSNIQYLLTGKNHKNLNNRAAVYIHETHLRVLFHGSDKGDEVFEFPLSVNLRDHLHLNDHTWRNSDG